MNDAAPTSLVNHWRYGASQALADLPEREFMLATCDQVIGPHPDPTGHDANLAAAWLVEDIKDVIIDALRYATVYYTPDGDHALNLANVMQAPARLAEDPELLAGLERAAESHVLGNNGMSHYALVLLIRAARRVQFTKARTNKVIPLYPERMEGAA